MLSKCRLFRLLSSVLAVGLLTGLLEDNLVVHAKTTYSSRTLSSRKKQYTAISAEKLRLFEKQKQEMWVGQARARKAEQEMRAMTALRQRRVATATKTITSARTKSTIQKKKRG